MDEAMEEIGTEDTRRDTETEKLTGNMDVKNTGVNEQAEAKEKTGTEDSRDEETDRRVENMEITDDSKGKAIAEFDGPISPHGEEDEAIADKERNLDVTNSGEDEHVNTKGDTETEKLTGNMDVKNTGENEEAEAKEKTGTEDSRDEETDRGVENMEITDDGKGKAIVEFDGPKSPHGEEDEAMADKERNLDVTNNGEDVHVNTKEETGTEDTRDGEPQREVENMDITIDGEGVTVSESDRPISLHDEEDEAMADEETTTVDTEVDTETDVAESGKAAGGKRKRRKNKSPANTKVAAKSHKIMEEDVCFICFDGGELVLCDRRGCPKAYHPSCVNRDDAFFRSKGRWNCGWHLCSICEKNAHYMCYTCTFSLCKGCTKDAVILCVRGNKGFCEACMRTIMLIEKNEQDEVDFDDKSSWEYLFKDYYIDLKDKLSLTSDELAEAKNPCKASDTPAGKQDKVSSRVREKVSAGKQESPEQLVDTNDGADIDADTSNENVEARKSKRRKVKTRSKTRSKEDNLSDGDNSTPGDTEWASTELLEFVSHMRNGDKSLLLQYDVQALLLEYIKKNNLRDPRQKSRIICDSRLQSLFGKQRVGHFEMLKLLESHFLIKDDSQIDDVQANVFDTEVDKLEVDDALTKGGRDKKRKRRKGDRRGPQSNLDDYAAIDMHNIGLIYLRRKLMEDLLEDIETFNDRVVGTFVRIRISGSAQKQDLYRLVQVVGTTKAAEPYKVGKKSTDTTVEILNLNKTEVVSIDTLSNQDFTEEECKRLRQSIKCGLINRLTVGDMLDKAMELQTTRVNDWLESEIMRLSHLRDRASEKGRKKELRECVEKLQLLKTPEERQRRLEEIPEIHADPRMDPSYESEEDENESNDNRREFNTKSRGSGSRGGRGPISPGSDFYSKDSWSSGGKYPSKNWDSDRNLSNKNTSIEGGDNFHTPEAVSENPWNQGRDRGALESSLKFGSVNYETTGWNSPDLSKSELFTAGSSATSLSSLSARVAEPTVKINESEKVWHYKDPAGKVQGPFSMVQLRKWSNTGYFPTDLRIWRATEKQDDSILLTDALAGKFQRESVAAASTLSSNLANVVMGSLEKAREGQGVEKLKVDNNRAAVNLLSHMGSPRGQTTPSIELPKVSTETWSRNDLTNLPSPTPTTKTADSTGQGGPVAGLGGVPTPELGGTVVPANTSQTSQSAVAAEPHAAQMHNHVVTAPDMVAHPVQAINRQNPIVETHGWGGAPAQKAEANPSIPVSGQQQPYAQWGVIPSTVQTHASNFSSSGASPLPPPDLWGPAQASQPNMQFPAQASQPNMQLAAQASQPNMQLPATPSLPWAGGMPENNNTAQVFRPENSNYGWSVMQGNPNMGWVGAPPLNANMNWAPTIQGQPPGNAAVGWTMPTVNPQGMGLGNSNQSWIPPTGSVAPTVQGPYPVNGWAPPPGTPGPPVQGPVPGNANQSWGAPAANQGTWSSEQNYGRGKFSGQRENGSHGGDSGFGSGRPWNKQSSFGNGGSGGSSRHFPRHQTPCPYNKNGQCRKGASCNYLHT